MTFCHWLWARSWHCSLFEVTWFLNIISQTQDVTEFIKVHRNNTDTKSRNWPTVNTHVYTLSSDKQHTAFWEVSLRTLFHITWFDDVNVSWAVIGSGVAAVGVAAGPARSGAVLQLSATFFSIICNSKKEMHDQSPHTRHRRVFQIHIMFTQRSR